MHRVSYLGLKEQFTPKSKYRFYLCHQCLHPLLYWALDFDVVLEECSSSMIWFHYIQVKADICTANLQNSAACS